MRKTQKYICVADYQETGFHVGDVMTAEEWKEWALSTNDMDESENCEEFKQLSPQEALRYIEDMWQIEIVPYDKNNAEHRELKEDYERSF